MRAARAGDFRARFRARYGPWGLVAGASEGLGAEFAEQLASKGLNLVLVARRAEKLEALADRLAKRHAIQARPLPLDLAQPGSVLEVAALAQEVEIGLLVYNAAFSAIGPFWENPLEDHYKELEVNCRTPLALSYLFVNHFQRRGRGGIVLMSSLSASQGSALISNYTATKAYNLLLAEGLWEELREQGVDVLACCAGAIRTPGYLDSLSGKQEQVPAMEPGEVVKETLAALGVQPSVIPGRQNRLSAFLMRRVLPRQAAIRLMGRVLRKLYAPQGTKSKG